jgi:hypothetical protein
VLQGEADGTKRPGFAFVRRGDGIVAETLIVGVQVVRWAVGLACIAAMGLDAAFADDYIEPLAVDPPPAPVAETEDKPPDPLLDRTHAKLHAFMWRTAMHVDGWFGSTTTEDVYAAETRGSMTPIVLWDEFNGLSQKFRFKVRMPLPHMDERYNAFIGTFSRDEFVTEREQASGAIPRQRTGGEVEQDETLVGIQYRGRRQGGRLEADAGIRIRSPIDPFVKGTYRFERPISETGIFSLRQTAFWQNSEGLGFTSRIDFERAFERDTLLRWTASGTISEESEGVRGYSALTMYRTLSGKRAVGGQLFTSGEFDAAVPLGEYGVRVAYRKRIFRDWLVLELRPSVTWPKDDPDQTRKASWGFGVGFEMFFGQDEFQARPATF